MLSKDHERDVIQFFQQVQSYIQWTPKDAELAHAAWPAVKPIVGELVDDFYGAITQHEFTARVITGGEQQIARLKRTLAGWLESLFTDDYDDNYAVARWQVGKRHVEIGLNQAYAMAALTRMRQFINRHFLLTHPLDEPGFRESIVTINKLFDLDAALIDFAYQQSNNAKLEENALIKIKQKERLASIGMMVTGLAHESRNALQRSQACLEALKLDIADHPWATKQADRIQSALDRLNVLYEEVRNYAAPINLDRQNVDLAKLAQTVWMQLQPRWQDQQTKFEVVADEKESYLALVDRLRIDQVMTNLFQNAIDASGSQGIVRFSIQNDPDRRSCLMDIEDSGAGIPEEQLPKIFEPFFTTKTKGTGLGLAITRRIVEAHNGALQVATSDLGGAKFTVEIPIFEHSKSSGANLRAFL